MKSKGKKIVIGIVLTMIIGFVGIKVSGFQFARSDKKAILTTEDITE